MPCQWFYSKNVCPSVTFRSLKINSGSGELCTESPFNFACLMKTLAVNVFSVTFRTKTSGRLKCL